MRGHQTAVSDIGDHVFTRDFALASIEDSRFNSQSMAKTSVSLLEELRTRPSEQAWQRMVRIYDALFRSWLSAQGVAAEDCDDLVQEILLVMMRKLPEFEHSGRTGAFRRWAKMLALNCVRRSWRARKRKPLATGDSAFLDSLNQLEDPSSELSLEWERQHDRIVTQRLLDLVQAEADPRVWQAFSRHAINGEIPTEVAVDLSVSPSFVYVAKSRILSRLRELAEGLVDEV